MLGLGNVLGRCVRPCARCSITVAKLFLPAHILRRRRREGDQMADAEHELVVDDLRVQIRIVPAGDRERGDAGQWPMGGV